MIARIATNLAAALCKACGNTPCAAVGKLPSQPGAKTPRPAMRRLLPLALLLLLPGLASCGAILNPGTPPARLRLAPAMPDRMNETPMNAQLVVAMPLAGRDIDTDHIALIFNNREVRHLADARWASPVPQIVQRALIDALTASNALRGVTDESAGISARVKLLSDVRLFALRYDDPKGIPTAVASITFSLLHLPDGAILGTRSVQIEVPAGGRDTMALAAACETALSRCLAKVTPWAVRTIGGKLPR